MFVNEVKSRIVVFLACILLLISDSFGQTKTYQVPTDDEFDEIYEMIFPRKTSVFDATTQEFSLDIRVVPSFTSPVQLSIKKFRNGNFEIIRYDLSTRNLPLFEQLIALPNYGQEKDYLTLAKGLKIESKVPQNLQAIKTRLKTFFQNTEFRRETNFFLDGVSYEVWYVDNGSRFHFEQIAGEMYERGESKLVTFARKIMAISEK